MIKINNKQNIPFFIYKVKSHFEIKHLILDAINSMGKYSFINDEQSISNSDWQLSKDFERPYFQYVESIFNDVCNELKNIYQYKEKLNFHNYWFQQYEYGDYHSWHHHPGNMFNAIYYVDLNSKNPKTSFKLFDNEFDIEVNEGDILISPSFLLHCSKLNKYKTSKTVIPFNIT